MCSPQEIKPGSQIGDESYLCLRASATVGINPNVFSLNATTLVKVHVLHELFPHVKSVYVIPLWLEGHCGNPKSRIKRTFPVLETTVADSDACREEEKVRLGST